MPILCRPNKTPKSHFMSIKEGPCKTMWPTTSSNQSIKQLMQQPPPTPSWIVRYVLCTLYRHVRRTMLLRVSLPPLSMVSVCAMYTPRHYSVQTSHKDSSTGARPAFQSLREACVSWLLMSVHRMDYVGRRASLGRGLSLAPIRRGP